MDWRRTRKRGGDVGELGTHSADAKCVMRAPGGGRRVANYRIGAEGRSRINIVTLPHRHGALLTIRTVPEARFYGRQMGLAAE